MEGIWSWESRAEVAALLQKHPGTWPLPAFSSTLLAILIGEQGFLSVLICVSLITYEVEHLFLCLYLPSVLW